MDASPLAGPALAEELGLDCDIRAMLFARTCRIVQPAAGDLEYWGRPYRRDRHRVSGENQQRDWRGRCSRMQELDHAGIRDWGTGTGQI